jgi:hypothetical protein
VSVREYVDSAEELHFVRWIPVELGILRFSVDPDEAIRTGKLLILAERQVVPLYSFRDAVVVRETSTWPFHAPEGEAEKGKTILNILGVFAMPLLAIGFVVVVYYLCFGFPDKYYDGRIVKTTLQSRREGELPGKPSEARWRGIPDLDIDCLTDGAAPLRLRTDADGEVTLDLASLARSSSPRDAGVTLILRGDSLERRVTFSADEWHQFQNEK